MDYYTIVVKARIVKIKVAHEVLNPPSMRSKSRSVTSVMKLSESKNRSMPAGDRFEIKILAIGNLLVDYE
jgi:hypothetical protein